MKLTIMYCILRSIAWNSHGSTTQPYIRIPLCPNLTIFSFYSRINGTVMYRLDLSNTRLAKNQRKTSFLFLSVEEVRSDLLTLLSEPH
jgi:hypothetical protein